MRWTGSRRFWRGWMGTRNDVWCRHVVDSKWNRAMHFGAELAVADADAVESLLK